MDLTGGAVIVCAWLLDGEQHHEACLRSLVASTAPDVRILVCSAAAAFEGVDEERFEVVRPAGIDDALAGFAAADLVLIRAPCVVGPDWLQGLRDAAYSDSTVATASALPMSELFSSAGEPGSAELVARSLQASSDFESAARAVHSKSLRLRPRLEHMLPPCMFVRRAAIELVGQLELGRDSGVTGVPGGGLADFARRCSSQGLCHVIADDVLVLDRGSSSSSSRRPPSGPRARSLGVARRALFGLSVLVDARIDADPMPGTALQVLELVAALARSGQARVAALVHPDPRDRARAVLEGLAGVRVIPASADPSAGQTPVADIAHRPFQISTPADLAVLARWADRLVVTHQDLISYRNPSYFEGADAFEGYRALTRRALAAADTVVFYTSHGRADALADELVEPDRASVVHMGVDHTIMRSGAAPVRPSGAERLPEQAPVMLCLGTDFRHKNRPFALRILGALQRRHRWPGWLVLAGPKVRHGSSAPEERELLDAQPELASALLDVGEVDEAEKVWLLERCDLVIYPTVYEGFGLIPFEAADHDRPCLWARGTSLGELLPDEAAGIVPWDAAVSADRALELMSDQQARARNIEAVKQAAAGLRWDATAQRLLEIYQSTCDEPPTTAAALERSGGLMQGGFSEDAVRLVGPDGALPRDLERPLLALATHPKVGAPLLGAIRAGYRASHRLRLSRRKR
jgi:glycosyltransferase involved in cell wall biosynthesis